MSKARLIKREEMLEREPAAPQPAPLAFVAQVKADAIKHWVKRPPASQQSSPRELFAALFGQPQAS